jgi:hypothetical protein
MKPQLLSLAAFVAGVSARWSANLNYRSPSEHHPFMGIAIHKVVKRRDLTKRFDPAQLNFTHGVASGDPYDTSVILWTRCSPVYDDDKSNVTVSGTVPLYNHDTAEYVAVSVAPVCVDWKVYSDSALKTVVSSGQAYTSSDIDYTVKVILSGTSQTQTCSLQTGRSYWSLPLHAILLPIQCLQFDQHQPCRQDKDCAHSQRQDCCNQSCHLLVLKLQLRFLQCFRQSRAQAVGRLRFASGRLYLRICRRRLWLGLVDWPHPAAQCRDSDAL